MRATSARLAMISSIGALAPEPADALELGLGKAGRRPGLGRRAGEIGDGDVRRVQIVDGLDVLELGIVGEPEQAQARTANRR